MHDEKTLLALMGVEPERIEQRRFYKAEEDAVEAWATAREQLADRYPGAVFQLIGCDPYSILNPNCSFILRPLDFPSIKVEARVTGRGEEAKVLDNYYALLLEPAYREAAHRLLDAMCPDARTLVTVQGLFEKKYDPDTAYTEAIAARTNINLWIILPFSDDKPAFDALVERVKTILENQIEVRGSFVIYAMETMPDARLNKDELFHLLRGNPAQPGYRFDAFLIHKP